MLRSLVTASLPIASDLKHRHIDPLTTAAARNGFRVAAAGDFDRETPEGVGRGLSASSDREATTSSRRQITRAIPTATGAAP